MARTFSLFLTFSCLIGLSFLYADKGKNLFFHHYEAQPGQPAPPETPWLTGPLLTPSSQTVAPGYLDVEPYVFYNVFTGYYDKDWKTVSTPNFYNCNIAALIYFGINKWMDVFIFPGINYNKTMGVSSLEFGDFPIGIEFQALSEAPDNSYPGLKFYIQETFPTGKYQKLKPERLLTDAGGKGSYQTEVGFIIGRLIHIKDDYFANLRLNLFYNYLAPVHVKGLNAFGGARDTSGRIHLGSQLGYLFGAEFTLSKNWAFAFDATGTYTMKSTFSGRRGTSPITILNNTLALPTQLQFTVAPAIEYNFSQALGIIGGAWLTVAGKTSTRFISGAIAINYYGPVPFTHPKKTPGQ